MAQRLFVFFGILVLLVVNIFFITASLEHNRKYELLEFKVQTLKEEVEFWRLQAKMRAITLDMMRTEKENKLL